MKTVEFERNKFQEEPMLAPSLFPGQARGLWRMPGLKKRILILGTGQLAVDLCQVITSRNRWLVEIVGFLGGKTQRVETRLVNPGIVGTYDQLSEVVEQHRVDTIVVCLEDRRSVLPVQALLDSKAMGLEVLDGHHLFEEASGRLSIDSLRPSALIFSTGFRRRLPSLVSKRLLDVVASAVGLVVLTPLFILLAAVIRLDSPGPVFYRQVRVGLRGRPYMIWKFRSMRQDAEKSGPRWAQANDPRISRVGWWLRKTRLDELPQLINVLKGDMSLVGPRPERPVFVQDLRVNIPYYDIRHTVRPGVTGWAQVKFRYGASQEDSHTKLQYDLYYVKNLSLLLDLKILMHTIRVVMLGEGAQ
ncbi:MAG: TIGR03013 family PEP-CTERM/XrtA system glycosyltransferase [Nitrospira sp.]|jgi:sugar transferase (PEP-CTERM system associated)|nr:TIGR03013 family PEP-CTERM/XrtA system glycosyltransferase [Nitrospira sp.]